MLDPDSCLANSQSNISGVGFDHLPRVNTCFVTQRSKVAYHTLLLRGVLNHCLKISFDRNLESLRMLWQKNTAKWNLLSLCVMVVATFLLLSKNLDKFNEIQSFDVFVEWQAMWLPRSHITIHSAGDFFLFPFFQTTRLSYLSRDLQNSATSLPRVRSNSGTYAFREREKVLAFEA